jgi:hypothetical protein
MPKAQPLLLDFFPNAAAAYSLRKLRRAYSGSAIRVRRSSDNEAQDIGFNSSGQLDTVALLAFCGVGDGFVTIWYDQSTNGVNVSQPAALNQPRIVNAGVIEVENGKNALSWYDTSQFFNGGNILGLDNKSLQIYVVARNTVTSNRAQLVSKSVSTADTNRYGLATGGALGASMLVHTTTNEYTANSNVAHANQTLFNGNYLINHEVRALVNNSSVASLSSPNGTVQNFSRRFLIGATNNTNNNGEIAYFRGTIQEVILYIAPTVDLPSLSNVNTNINSFYTIY